MKDNLRVAMIIQRYSPHIGGAERQLAAIAPRLRQRGVDVHIFTRRYPGLQPYEVINDIPVHRLPMPGPKLFASLSFTLSGISQIGKFRPDIIHAHELLSPTTTAVLARQIYGIPVVAKPLRGGRLGDLARLRRSPLSARRIPLLLSRVDRFIAISQEIDSELEDIGVAPERRVFIPNGVDLERYSPLPPEEKLALRRSLGCPPGPLALFAGRLSPEKNLRRLVELWPAVRRSFPTAELWLLGAGEEENVLRKMACAGVCLLGPKTDVLAYLRAADLFILPSNTEGLSNALLEACACGLPTVATAIGGSVEIIQDRQTGLLIPPDDSPALLAAILELLGSPALRDQLGQRSRQHVLQKFALTATVERLLALYRSLDCGEGRD